MDTESQDLVAKPEPRTKSCNVCCCAPVQKDAKGYCRLWKRSGCAVRCGIVCGGVTITLLVAWTIVCITALCCIDVDCAKYPGYTSDSKAAKIPLIFVHGIEGAHLKNSATGAQMYLTGFQALGLDSPDLSLPLEWQGDSSQWQNPTLWHQGRDKVVTDGPLDQIVVASCIRVSVYRKPLSYFKRCLGRPYFTFVYDWRRDQLEAAYNLVSEIKRVSAENGGVKVQLIGHSNGGILSAIAINLLGEEARVRGDANSSLVHSVVYVATPFSGSMGVLYSFKNGISVGLTNKESLNANRMLSQTGRMGFLPLARNDFADAGASFFNDASGMPVNVNISDPKVWMEMGLSPSVTGPSDPGYVFLHDALRRASLVREWLYPRPGLVYPPAVVFAGRALTCKTNYTVKGYAPGAARPWASATIDYTPSSTVPCDGSVRFAGAFPLQSSPYLALVEPDASLKLTHSYLLDDLKSVKAALDVIPY